MIEFASRPDLMVYVAGEDPLTGPEVSVVVYPGSGMVDVLVRRRLHVSGRLTGMRTDSEPHMVWVEPERL